MAVSQYGASVVLQNNSGSAAASAAPTGSVFLFASGAQGSAKLYMNKEGSQDVFEVGADLKFAGDSGTGTVGVGAGQTFTIAGGTGLDTSASNQTLTFSMDLNELSAAAVDVAADSIAIVDATDNSTKKESIADLMTAAAGNGLAASSGVLAVGVDDATIELNSDALRIKDGGVDADALASSVAGNGLAGGGGTALSLDLNELSAAAVNAAADSIAIIDADDNSSKKESIADLATAMAGDGLVASSGAFALNVADMASAMTGDLADDDEFAISDGGTMKKVDFSVVRDAVFADVSGDATVAAGGALTIAADAVEGSMLNDNVISGQTELAHADIADADELMISDGGTLKKVGLDSLRDHYFGQVSGDATIADGGALTIAANAVQTGMVHDDVATELAGNGLAAASGVMSLDLDELSAAAVDVAADSIAILDATDDGSKKESIADFATAMAGNGLAASSGVFAVQTSGSVVLASDKLGLTGSIAGAGLTFSGGRNSISSLSLDIDELDALGGTGVAQGDHFLFSDAGTEKKITFSNLEDAIFGNVSGDATVAAGGALTIAADAVEGSMLNDNVISGQTELAHADIADADELMISDGGTLKKVGLDSLRDHYFGQVSGDATVADGGALTIAADAVESGMLNDNVISGQSALGSAAAAQADELLFSDDGTLKKITFSNLEDSIFGNVSGDATIAAGGALTIAANAVQTGMVHDDVATELAGNGLSAASGVLAVGVDDSSLEIDSDALRVKASGITSAMIADGAIVNADVNASAAIEATKLNFNVDLGGNVQFGTQSDDTVAFAGPIKAGANAIADSGNNAAITFDGSAGMSTLGGFGGGSGISFSAAAGAQFATDLTVNKSDGSMNKDVKFYGDTAGARFEWDGGEDRVKIHDGSAQVLEMGNTAAGYAIDVTNGSANVNKVRAAAFVTYSDESLKSDVATMNTALDTVMSLEGVEFTWNDSGERDFGFIAQDVQAVLPKAVHVAEDGVQGVDYSRLTSVLVEAVKAQQVQINDLKKALKK